MEHLLELHPRDLLFFRDARPMAASDIGAGAHWPFPSVLHEALLTSFGELWPERQPWEHRHTNRRDSDNNWETSRMRFGGLRTAGPFPALDGHLLLPTPADLVLGDEDRLSLMAPVELPGTSNLPAPLRYPVARNTTMGKRRPGTWLSARGFERYLCGDLDGLAPLPRGDVAAAERRVGVAIDPHTHGTVEGRLYASEYLRLCPAACLAAWASCPNVYHTPELGAQSVDAVAEWLAQGDGLLVMGGQGGVLQCAEAESGQWCVPSLAAEEVVAGQAGPPFRVKWVLLTHAIFANGWLPGWVDASDGHVLLRAPTPRQTDEKRAAWRERLSRVPPVAARLVAARVPGSVPLSGWSLLRQGPKATNCAVPPGSVYYFETTTIESATALVTVLSQRRGSDRFGEKGFGLGACAPWKPSTLQTT